MRDTDSSPLTALDGDETIQQCGAGRAEGSSSMTQREGRAALERLVGLCRHVGGGTEPIAEFLVSLYNARYAKVDAYMLCRRIDDEHFEDVVSVMRMFRDAPGWADVHTLVADGEKSIRRIMDAFGFGPRQPDR